MIDSKVLLRYGASEVNIGEGEVIFKQGRDAQFYFQVVAGAVKMVTDSPDGKQFIHGIFKQGESFGEPPLFCGFPYPTNAVALEDSSILKIEKNKFFQLLKENFELHLALDKVLCERLRYKSMLLAGMWSDNPKQRVYTLLNHLKKEAQTFKGAARESKYIVGLTRQQLADMSGLRVETVIRAVKHLEDEGKLRLVERKIEI